MLDATLLLQAVGGQWETCGAERLRGITPEGIVATANPWGSDTLNCRLRRSAGSPWADLLYGTPAELRVGGKPVWAGRIKETPSSDGDEDIINVSAEGWQYHLDDDVVNKKYVHTRLPDWRDIRSFLTATINRVGTAAGQVTTDRGAITIGWPKGAQLGGASNCCVGVTIDLGPTNSTKRIVIDWAKIGATAVAGLFLLAIRGHDTEDGVNPGSFENALAADVTTLGATGTTAFTFTTARRYVTVFLNFNNAANTTLAEDNLFRITAAKLFAATAYESGNASILKASAVISDVLGLGITPKMSTDLTQISATSFNIPEFAIDGYHTPREIADAVNAYHAWLAQVDVDKRLIFQALPVAPLVEIGNWAGSSFEDASTNSGDEVYDQVIVQSIGSDGADLSTKRTQSATTILSRQGFHRTKILPVKSALATAAVNQIGDTFLSVHKTTPLKGAAKITGNGARQVIGGRSVHPADLLRQTGQLLRLAHHVDPDTGGLGRDGRIAQVTYSHDTQSADVQLDSTRTNFEAFLERLAVVTG